jgi:hypothetical protein
VTLKVEKRYHVRCTECGQSVETRREPQVGDACERCEEMRTLGVTVGSVVGVRVRIASLSTPREWVVNDSTGCLQQDQPAVWLLGGGRHQSVAFSCHMEDLGLWSARLGSDYVQVQTQDEKP